MPATNSESKETKADRDRDRDRWLGQHFGIDEIASRFRREYRVGGLRAYRYANDMTLERVANTYNSTLDPDDPHRITLQMVWQWEHWPEGHRCAQPSLVVLERLAVIYGTTITCLVAAIYNDADQIKPGGDWPAGSDTVQPLSGLDADRIAEEFDLTRLGASGRGSRAPGPVDGRKVELLEQVTATHRELYHSSSAAELIDPLCGHLSAVLSALRATPPVSLQHRLASIAAETAGHIAWLCHDQDDDRGAARYYALSTAVIRQAGNPALDAYVQGFKSQVHLHHGRLEQTRRLAEGASRKAARSGTATLRAWLWGLRAQALARLGDTTGCVAALKHAETAVGQSQPSEDPPWLDVFDPARYAALAGSCYRTLGQPGAAEELLQEALIRLDPSCIRRRSIVLLDLAFVELTKITLNRHGDPERACQLACTALNGLAQNGSHASIQQVIQFRSELDGHGEPAALADLDDQLASVLGAGV